MRRTRAVVVIIVLGVDDHLHHIALVYAALVDGHLVAQQFAAVEPALAAGVDSFRGLKNTTKVILVLQILKKWNTNLTITYL